MPKAVWSSDINKGTIEGYEGSAFVPYDGPIPRDGVYQFTVKSIQKVEASTGTPQLRVVMLLDPRTDRPDDKRYAGCPVIDFIPVLPQTDFRWVPLLRALRVSATDFLNNTVLDSDDKKTVTKMGKVIPEGAKLFANIKTENDNNGQPRLNVKSYLEPSDDDDSGTAAVSDATPEAGGEPEPF